ncbi:MAG: hypothetical protein GF399_00610 [Candidatus Coatesbacteria bacterium]|nr:hypothetical protein [Candidatus Coatesbacteria bacterium]
MAKRRKKRKRSERSLGWGIVLILAGLFSFVCLAAYLNAGAPPTLTDTDSSFVGAWGLSWGRAQLWLVGYLGFALALVVIYAGQALIRAATERLGRQLLGFLLLIGSLALFFDLVGAERAWPLYGGRLGRWISGSLTSVLGGFGTVLLGSLLLLFGFTLATGLRLREIGAFFGRGGKRMAAAVKRGRDKHHQGAAKPPSSEKCERPPDGEQPTSSIEQPVDAGLEPAAPAAAAPPPLDTLGAEAAVQPTREEPDERPELLRRFLEQHGVAANIIGYRRGPSLGVFELRLAPRERLKSLERLTPELSLALKSPAVRVVPRSEAGTVNLEIPLSERRIVALRELLEDEAWQRHASPLAFPVGLGQDGAVVIADLAKLPHLLIAGTTGSGKSVFLNAVLLSLLSRVGPQTLRLLLIDPGRVELAPYAGLPHLIGAPITDPQKALVELEKLVAEMDRRYTVLAKAQRRSIETYNELAAAEDKELEPLPWIVIAVDELAELMAATGKSVETPLARLAQMARAVGLHLLVATQRPSVDVVTGVLKANFPSRAAFKVRSAVDSRVILDEGGAEKLLGRGDLLFLPVGAAEPLRLQAGYVDEGAVLAVVRHWRARP